MGCANETGFDQCCCRVRKGRQFDREVVVDSGEMARLRDTITLRKLGEDLSWTDEYRLDERRS